MDAFLGMIAAFGFTFPPRDWAFCSAQLVPVNQNTALFSLLGTNFGGDGRVYFGYPDLRARMAVGSADMGTPPGLLPIPLGLPYGEQTKAIGAAELPTHAHTATFTQTGTFDPTFEFEASASSASLRNPAPGDYLGSQPPLGTFPDMYVDSASPGTLVPLGGVDFSGGLGGGYVSTGDTGSGATFSILNPFQAVNFCICEDGIYPSRN